MNKGKKICALVLAAAVIGGLQVPVSFAQSEVDSLLNVLVTKGIITRGEAVQILEEANTAAQIQQVNAIKEGPSWLANTTFKGDLRIRHQYENKEADSSKPKQRFRTRLRYGFENTINQKLAVGLRLATGSNTENTTPDPRSTNQTWGDVFSNWQFNVDEAYFDYHPFDWVSIIGGKREVSKVMFRTSDLIWDSDLTFDGGTLMLNKEVGSGFSLFTNVGAYVLQQEVNDDNHNNNPWMLQIQPGFKYVMPMQGSSIDVTAGIAYVGLRNTKDQANTTILNSKSALSGNSTNADGTLKYHYDVFYPNMALSYKWGGDKGDTYAATFLGDYIYNPSPKDTGYSLGAKIGYNKVGKKFGDWQLGYMWRYLEDDAFLAAFPDSDAYSGHTNVKGSEISFEMGLAKNVVLGLDYYYMEPISGSTRNSENLFQTDLVFKF